MINKLWIILFVSGSFHMIFIGKFDLLNEQILTSGKTTLDLIIQILPLISLWLGIMNIAKKSGLLKKISKMLEPILIHLFPEIPKGHESFEYISSNIVANIFGLGNAATPFGIKAMESMQKINKNKSVASKSMITFLIMNTTGITLIPTTIISLRLMHKSTDASSIILPCIIVSTLSFICAIMIDRLVSKHE